MTTLESSICNLENKQEITTSLLSVKSSLEPMGPSHGIFRLQGCYGGCQDDVLGQPRGLAIHFVLDISTLIPDSI